MASSLEGGRERQRRRLSRTTEGSGISPKITEYCKNLGKKLGLVALPTSGGIIGSPSSLRASTPLIDTSHAQWLSKQEVPIGKTHGMVSQVIFDESGVELIFERWTTTQDFEVMSITGIVGSDGNTTWQLPKVITTGLNYVSDYIESGTNTFAAADDTEGRESLIKNGDIINPILGSKQGLGITDVAPGEDPENEVIVNDARGLGFVVYHNYIGNYVSLDTDQAKEIKPSFFAENQAMVLTAGNGGGYRGAVLRDDDGDGTWRTQKYPPELTNTYRSVISQPDQSLICFSEYPSGQQPGKVFCALTDMDGNNIPDILEEGNTPSPSPESPTPSPESPTPSPESPTPSPESPTPSPEGPILYQDGDTVINGDPDGGKITEEDGTIQLTGGDDVDLYIEGPVGTQVGTDVGGIILGASGLTNRGVTETIVSAHVHFTKDGDNGSLTVTNNSLQHEVKVVLPYSSCHSVEAVIAPQSFTLSPGEENTVDTFIDEDRDNSPKGVEDCKDTQPAYSACAQEYCSGLSSNIDYNCNGIKGKNEPGCIKTPTPSPDTATPSPGTPTPSPGTPTPSPGTPTTPNPTKPQTIDEKAAGCGGCNTVQMTKIDAARIHNNTLVGTVEMADHFHEPKLPSELLGVGTLGTSVLLMIGAVRGQMGKNLSKRIGGMKKYF